MNKEQLERFIGSWNGEDRSFVFEGSYYTEDDVHEAEERLRELENAEETKITLKDIRVVITTYQGDKELITRTYITNDIKMMKNNIEKIINDSEDLLI